MSTSRPTESTLQRRGLRYVFVSAINVPLVQVTIFALQAVGGMQGWLANATAVTALTGPAYLMSKRWVWPESERNDARVVWLFWVFSIGGLLASTFAVWALAQVLTGIWVANAASIAVYGSIFVGRFALLDQMFMKETDQHR